MKYFYYITLLILTASCSKSNSLKKAPLKNEEKIKELRKKTVSNEKNFPTLELNSLNDFNIHVYDNEKEHSFSRKLDLVKEDYIRAKMERILYNRTPEKLSYRDIYKFQFNISKVSRVKLFKNIRFSELSKYESRLTTSFQVSSLRKVGIVKDISYKFSLIDSETGEEGLQSYNDLLRYENQNEVINLSKNEVSNYEFESGVVSYSSLVNKLISGEKIIYEVINYSENEMSLDQVNKKIEDDESYLFVSLGKNKTHKYKISDGESIKSSLKKIDPSSELSINGNIRKLQGKSGEWKLVNFESFDIDAEKGSVYGIYYVDVADSIKTKKISSRVSVENLNLIQEKNETLELYIQLSKINYELSTSNQRHFVKRVYKDRCDSRGNNCKGQQLITSPAIKYCHVSYQRINSSDKTLIDSEILTYINISLSGEVFTLREFIDKGFGSVYFVNGTIHISIFPFSSIADFRELKIISNSTTKKVKIRSEKLDCPVLLNLNNRIVDGTYNFMIDYLEGYEDYEEDSFVGEKIFQDILIIK